MSERQDFIALEWVAGEIEQTLGQAKQALDSYLLGRNDTAQLRLCLTHIHQVHGTLEMVEFFGAALLAEEMERVTEALYQNTIHSSHIDDALQVLGDAIVQMPRYLEQVKESRHGLPAALLPVLNNLRAVRGENLLSETALFAPDIAAEPDDQAPADLPISADKLGDVTHKLRQMYQVALLGVIRRKELKKNLNFLAKVCARLSKLTEGQASQPLWRVCIALLEGLLNGSIEDNVAVKILLRQIDRQLKQIVEQGEPALSQPPPADLLKNLLYYVARSRAKSRYIQAIKTEFNLDSSLLGEDQLSQTADSGNQQSLSSVMDALQLELEEIKAAVVAASNGSNGDALTEVMPLFRRAADTMAVLGMGRSLKPLQQAHTQMAALLASDGKVDKQPLEAIVEQLETAKRELAEQHQPAEQPVEKPLFNESDEAQQQLDRAFDSVVRESRHAMEQAKESIIEFVATQWDHQSLQELPELLSSISGSLQMVSLNEAGEVVDRCQAYINEQLMAKTVVPDWQTLDTLADAISSVDYYLERLEDDNDSEASAILDVARQSVAELGYPVDGQSQAQPPKLTAVDSVQPARSAPAEPAPDPTGIAAAPILTATVDSVDDSNAPDPEIVEIFIEEAGEVLATIDEYLPQWQQSSTDEGAAAEVRRAFHTLKGSGRMVEAFTIGELAWSIENMLNRVLDGSMRMDQPRFDLVSETKAMIPALIDAFAQHQGVDQAAVDALAERANVFAKQQHLGTEPDSTEQSGDESQELIAIFATEARAHTQVLSDFIAHCKQLAGPADLSDELQRALHTLKGSANMAAVTPVAMVVTPIEYAVKEMRSSLLKADSGFVELLERGELLIKAGIEQLTTTPMAVIPSSEQYAEDLLADFNQRIAKAGINEQDSSLAPEALNQFLTQGLDLLTAISGQLVLWQQQGINDDEAQQIQHTTADFAKAAAEVSATAPQSLAEALRQLFQRAASQPRPQDDFFALTNRTNDSLLDMLDQMAGQQTPVFDSALFAQVESYQFPDAEERQTLEPPLLADSLDADNEFVDLLSEDDALLAESDIIEIGESSTILMPAVDLEAADGDETEASEPEAPIELTDVEPAPLAEDPPAEDIEPAAPIVADEQPAEQEPPETEPTTEPLAAQADEDDIDDEIIEIFLEEADDLVEGMDGAIHGWTDDRSNGAYLDDLLRILHTLKGGARLADLTKIGDLSHDFETMLIDLEGKSVDEQTFNRIQNYQDQLLAELNKVKNRAATESEPPAPSAEPAALPPAEPTETSSAPALSLVVGATKQLRQVTDQQITTPLADNAQQKGPQEVVRVSAQLLEELVNLAGETSISRGRAEEQISELVFSLDEMQITVDRLQEQVRRLDMETEQQILYRQEQVESEGLEGFDPLEMDRYSQLQQLSRSLLESSSDLTDIKGTLADKARDMETLLVQQSRINTDLQEGLMRSQMVPFEKMVPRLRRIVRQISNELDKSVDFELSNIEGELDRTVLERMLPPLEHMLRNAVDHGIEDEQQRRAAGKSSRGTISLGLAREGGEVVITLADDGAGIDLEAVRNKAIERGLMEADAQLSDHEISQFILQAGFSTATEVTQISGRGVGMDVVHSEIKQLGGSMDILSVAGKGSRFIVRLPFTVSVNRALMVRIGLDNYAIPLNTIEGIVRVSPFELEAFYQPDAPMFEYAGQPYLLRYMGSLLQRGAKPNLEGQSAPLPVILVRGAEHSVAVQVDGLMGSREIVVKPLGPQFGMVQGLSGATVLGDGSVVVILDLLAMIRADASHMHRDLPASIDSDEDQQNAITVMVVDDSVTVRKVTSRFLEREGMEVVLAKDGVDAISQLQDMERIPDIMLLDIEMPRMDGFEVASRVRHNSRLQDIPIIMITSRTGEKHRERAFSLGVNDYMGKPYQENALLETIGSLLANTANQ